MRTAASPTESPGALPGPRPLLPKACFVAGWFSFLEECQRRYGDVFRLHIPFLGPVVAIGDPKDVRALYMADRDTTVSAALRARAMPAFNEGKTFAMLDGDAHHQRRRMLHPKLHGKHLAAFEPLIADVVAAHVERWKPGETLRLKHFASDVTTAINIRILFGIEGHAEASRFRDAYSRYVPAWAITAALPERLKSERFPGPWRTFMQRKRELYALIDAQIEACRRNGRRDAADFCSLLVASAEDGSLGLSHEEIRDELLTLGIGGTHTTATSFEWIFDYVLHHQSTLQRLEADPDDEQFRNAVAEETLRLRTPQDSAPRTLTEPVDLGGLRVPAGEIVFPVIHLIHRRPELYDRPNEFVPERFVGRKPSPYGWLVFGSGSRRCIGAALAQLEMRVVLREVLTRWRLTPLKRTVSRPRRQGIFWVPAGGVPVKVARRR